jgi:hypothetical protein
MLKTKPSGRDFQRVSASGAVGASNQSENDDSY